MAGQLTVVLSQGQSQAPDKRGLEEALVAALVMEKGIEVSVIPHLYDLSDDHTGMLYLRSVRGDMVLLAWIYPRAAHWVLDRRGIKGHVGTVLLKRPDAEDGEGEEQEDSAPAEMTERSGIGSMGIPDRGIYCMDLRDFDAAEPYLEEIRRIAAESRVQTIALGTWLPSGNGEGQREGKTAGRRDGESPGQLDGETARQGDGKPAEGQDGQTARRRDGVEAPGTPYSVPSTQYGVSSAPPSTLGPPPSAAPAMPYSVPSTQHGASSAPLSALGAPLPALDRGASALGPPPSAPSTQDSGPPLCALRSPPTGEPLKLLDPAGRRWYPVIDYDRCTNCMECIDFCLFGVYGVDAAERILVEQADNCKKGCPACSRVCPENAIIFPQHKTPAIAGAPGEGAGGLKIDLSKLFGAPSALELAAQERDVELVRDGRDAVGLTVGIPKRQANKAAQPKDELDELMDKLDELAL